MPTPLPSSQPSGQPVAGILLTGGGDEAGIGVVVEVVADTAVVVDTAAVVGTAEVVGTAVVVDIC